MGVDEEKVEDEVGERPSDEYRQSPPAPVSFFTSMLELDNAMGVHIPSSSSCACCRRRATCRRG